jgi:hypothetical protein
MGTHHSWARSGSLLAHSEKRRAEHAQQSFGYDGKVVWDNGLNPFVVDPATFLYIPTTWDGTLVVLSYGITHKNKNKGTGATEPECLHSSRCACIHPPRSKGSW